MDASEYDEPKAIPSIIAETLRLKLDLATTFVKLQRERVPERRQELWAECLRLAGELEKLSQ